MAGRLSAVRSKDDPTAFTLIYTVSSLTQFQFEQSMYRTRAANNPATDQGDLVSF